MSQTVNTIIANNFQNLNKELTKDFYTSLGDSNNLVYLDLSNNGNFSNVPNLGMAISFNALKNGALSYLDISNCGFNFDTFNNLIKGMKISEDEHNKWYGFQFNANIQKETPEYFNKIFHCNLETFVFNGSNFYSNVNYLDPKNANVENLMKTFLTESPKLETLILNDNNFNKFFLDAFADALRTKNNIKYLSISNSKIDGEKFKCLLSSFYAPLPEKPKEQKSKDKKEPNEEKKQEIVERLPNPNFHIEELDLSNNNLGYSGVDTLSNALKINKTIKKLNLFHNLFDVNGARRLAEVLKINTSLEELDIGYNRIKNAGFKSVLDSIKENKALNLKFLGLKYNFVHDKILEEQLDAIEENKEIGLEEIDLKNNVLSPGFLMELWEQKFKKMSKKLKVDIFDVCAFMNEERLERTIWLETGEDPKKADIFNEIQRCEKICVKNENSHVGIPLLIRKKRGRKTGDKKQAKCRNVFVEFIMPNSVNRMLKLASTSKFLLAGKKRKAFKAGTKPDYLVVKKRVNK
jgi:Ran GTPase-activating protein (RanGAP) involved in mRNA processing and transport